MKSILFIGRFQPIHDGHIYIMKEYEKNHFIKIGLGSPDKNRTFKNPFTKEERKEMIRLALEENNITNYQIIELEDTQTDKEWVKEVEEKASPFHIIVTGNDHVKECFPNKEIDYFKEDEERYQNIKAENIREQWATQPSQENLPQSVYKYLLKIDAHNILKQLKNSFE